MDTPVEKEFLELLEDEKEIILSKQNNKHAKDAMALAWKNVKLKLEDRTGKAFGVKRLQKKWNNTQTRLKEKNWVMKKTGESPAIKESPNDDIAERILGENNPKLVCVPGAMENGKIISFPSRITADRTSEESNDYTSYNFTPQLLTAAASKSVSGS